MGRLVENLMQTILPIHASSTSNKLSFVKHVPAVGESGDCFDFVWGVETQEYSKQLMTLRT